MGSGGHHTPGDPKAVLGAREPLLSPLCAPRRGAGLSESEAEPDGEHNITELPQAVAGRGAATCGPSRALCGSQR